jgi:hypothetical protein
MKLFNMNVKIEYKRLLTIITISLLISFFVFAMYFIQVGLNRYKETLVNKENFKSVEQAIVKKHLTYTIYAQQGFRILFVPSPVSIFFYDSGAFSEVSSTLDVGERLNINGTYKGQKMFRDLRGLYEDFSGLFVLFGTLIVLSYGYLLFQRREYQKTLASMADFKRLYRHNIASRFLLLALYFTAVTAACLAWVILNGVRFTGPDYLFIGVYLGIWLLAAFVLFNIGALVGAIKSKAIGITVLAAIWIFIFYLSPLIVNQVATANAGKMKTLYQQENEKWDAYMRFENRAVEEVGKFKPEIAKTQMEQQLIESFMNKEYKEVQAVEKNLEKEMRESKKVHEWLSLLSPGTILSAAACELSSQGPENLTDFHAYTQDLKDKFCQFYKYKKFYSPEEEKGVESFIKNEENIYYGHAALPSNIVWVLLELLALSFILYGLSYYCHKKGLTKVEGEMAAQFDPGTMKNIYPGNDKGKPQAWQIEEEGFIQRIYNYLSGKGAFLYLCRAEDLPGDMEAGDFLELSALLMNVSPDESLLSTYRGKKIESLKKLEKVKIVLDVVDMAERAGKRHFLFHDVAHDMPARASIMLKEKMEELSGRGAEVVLLVWNVVFDGVDSQTIYGIRDLPGWFKYIMDVEATLNKSQKPRQNKI